MGSHTSEKPMNATVDKVGFAGQGGFVCPLWEVMLFSPAEYLPHFNVRGAMNLVSHCQGAAGVGCCAGTGEPEQGWQQNMRAVPYPTLCSPVVKREQNRSSDSDKSPACKPIAMRQEGQGRK